MKNFNKYFGQLALLIAITNFLGISNGVAAVGTPSGKPGQVATLGAVLHSGSDINWDVNWTAPTDNGGSPITGYTISILKVSDSSTVLSCTTDATGITCLVTGLAYKTSYIARAFATNINGNGITRDTAPFTTSSRPQTWTTEPVDTTKSYGAADFQLTAIASSGLPVTWSSSNTAGCTVDATGVVHLVSTAGCTITYTQDGVGSPYNAITGSKNITVTGSTSTAISAVTDIQSTQARLNGTFTYGGQLITPAFCVSTSNAISTSCSGVGTVASYNSTSINNLTSPAVNATVTGLTAGVTYYVWTIATPAGGSPVTSPNTVSFTTTSGPTLAMTGTPTGTVGQTITLTFTAADGSGVYPVWDHGTLPTGFTFTPGVTQATITGSGTSVSSTPTWVSVSDSNSLTATKSTTIEITAASGGSSGSGSSGGEGSNASTKKNQTISNTEPPSPAYLTTPTLNLNGSASSGLPVIYITNTPSICAVDANGVVKLLAPGDCSITISQAGNSDFSPTSKNILIKVAAKVGIVLEEFLNVQSTSATAVATANWPGLDSEISFCISTINSKSDCTLPAGVSITEVSPSASLTSITGPTFTVNISGLNPQTNYYVWAVEKVGSETYTSEIRKLHTPVGPTITFVGKTEYKVNEPAKLVFHATDGAGSYKNWSVKGLPNTLVNSGGGVTYSTQGTFEKVGLYQAVVSVQDKNGISASINVSISVTDENTGRPASPSRVNSQVVSANKTRVSWQADPKVNEYLVNVGKNQVCDTNSNSCNIPQLLGPKSQISVTAVDGKGIKSIPAVATYKAPDKPIQVSVANFDLNQALLKPKDKAMIAKLAQVFLQQGFSNIQVSGYTDSKGNDTINTPLSKARANVTYKYLQNILSQTSLSVTLLAKGAAEPVASNKTIEGQAANRRAVLYLK